MKNFILGFLTASVIALFIIFSLNDIIHIKDSHYDELYRQYTELEQKYAQCDGHALKLF